MIHHNRLSRVLLKSDGEPTTLNGAHPLAAVCRWMEETLADHPKTSLVAALSAGMLAAWIIKRH
jgi:hypothetical protein